ncbi:TetR/AcrR family transcriptional regulator [Rhodospirillaceae bacterium KN72]|uniref:TetR/AcrR family transcriptional regulator n=1 Tax=Pacificispira spongiicola TaxID=2729598 RepID=A0A7Y0E167_9PROT|nr:TetR/AcrR family transcriptional regulator [Pacificispira spongiicola]NMM45329.1 TetR/AcrR family transcriptional regulator [Pacificispira spongiicola]
MPRNGDETRERIIKAARKLLYRDGVRATSVDAIAEQAGITKRSLYYHFRSKDDLIEAYLTSRDAPNLDWFKDRFDAVDGPISDRISAIFDGLVDVATHPKWRGCGYLRTAGELANMPGHPAIKASSAHKKRLEAWLATEFEAAGLASPEGRARQVVVLIDGAFSVMLVHHDTDYIRAAGEAARIVCSHAD